MTEYRHVTGECFYFLLVLQETTHKSVSSWLLLLLLLFIFSSGKVQYILVEIRAYSGFNYSYQSRSER